MDGSSKYGTFVPLLELAIDQVKPARILECGMGENSTQYLHDWAVEHNGKLLSFDTDHTWFHKYKELFTDTHTGVCAHFINDEITNGSYDIALIDHAPGEQRRLDIMRLIDRVKVFIVHDTEESADAYGYLFSTIWHHFKYIKHDTTGDVRTTALSNVVDVTEWELPKK